MEIPWREPDALAANEPQLMADGSAGGGQRRLNDAAVRKAIENYAMERAMAHFSAQWKRVVNVSNRASFDLFCSNGMAELRVEVKGTTGDGSSVLLTRNEVEHARCRHPNVALFVTAEVQLDRSCNPPHAYGGRDLVLAPWDISGCDLTPTVFDCRLPSRSDSVGRNEEPKQR
jgi:hypothetical protein